MNIEISFTFEKFWQGNKKKRGQDYSPATSAPPQEQEDCQKNGVRKIPGFYIFDPIFLTFSFRSMAAPQAAASPAGVTAGVTQGVTSGVTGVTESRPVTSSHAWSRLVTPK